MLKLNFNPPLSEPRILLQIPSFTQNSPTSLPFFSNSGRIPIQNPISCARKRRKQSRSDKSIRLLLNLASIAASRLKLLPQPLDLVLEEIGSGDGFGGGGLGFWKGFGWDGFDGWGRRRRKKEELVVVRICGDLRIGIGFGREIESNAVWWGLGLGPFGVALIQWWEKTGGVQAWVLGLCLWSFLVGLTFRREESQKWLAWIRVRVRVPIPMAESSRRRNVRGRRGRVF